MLGMWQCNERGCGSVLTGMWQCNGKGCGRAIMKRGTVDHYIYDIMGCGLRKNYMW